MKRFIILTLWLIVSIGNAQKQQSYSFNNTSLTEVIKHIEQQQDVNFSYAIDLIQGKQITLNIKDIELEELLDILESQTSLSFEKISENQIIIAPKNTDNKICGYVLDFDTKLPIPYAVISSSTGRTITSDSKGFFTIENTRNNNLSISSFGYITQEFLGKKTCQQIYLTVNNEVLDEVIISGYVTSGIDRNKDGSIDVTSNSLGILPGLVTPDLLQSIQLIPGINSLNESASGIQIRGGSPDQNLILFDDIKLYNTGHFYGMFSTLNPYATQKASIFKSGTSAVYGDRISGIIDISTGEDIPSKAEGGVGVEGLSVDGFIKTPISDKLAVYAFARRSYIDIYRSPTYDRYAEKIFNNIGVTRNSNGQVITVPSDDQFNPRSSRNSFSFFDISTKIIFEPNLKNKFIASGLFTRNTIDFTFIDDGETKDDNISTENNGLSLKWKHKSSETNTEDVTFYFSKYDTNYKTREFIGEELGEANVRNNFITDIGLNLKSHRNIGKRQYLTFGYQISNSNVTLETIKDDPVDPEDNQNLEIENKNLKNALFTEYNYYTKNSSVIGVGLRAVHYGSLGNIYIEPRINAEYKLSKSLRLKGSVERRHQPISQVIEFNQGELRIENSTWQLSNKTGNPLLRSDQISTGLLYHNKSWTIDLDAYYKNLTGLTSFTDGFRTPQLEQDIGKSIIKGIDVLIKKRINNYRIWAGYTFNDIRFNFPKIQSGDFPGNNDIAHSFRISNTLKVNDFEFSLGWQHRTGKPYTPIVDYDSDTALVNFGKINSARLKDYHRLDASAIYNFKMNKTKNWRAQLGVSALNIYNRIIPTSITYRTENEGAGLELQQVIYRYSLGFTPNASFRLFF